MNKITLSSFLAQAGLGSRRSCEKLITAGRVIVNNLPVRELTTYVDSNNDHVTYRGQALRITKKRYLLLHKPKGYTCSSKDKYAQKLVFDLIKSPMEGRLFTVGRLDKNSEGLLLLTNDGQFSQILTHPRYQIKKVYLVDIKGYISIDDMKRLEAGIIDEGENLKATTATVISRSKNGGILELSVAEGRKREIRRMCRHLNYRVKRLTRTAIGPLKLGIFRPGYHRELSDREIDLLRNAAQ